MLLFVKENCQCDATLLNFFQNTTSREYRIYSGIFVETKIFSKYNITTSVEAFYDKAMLHYLEGMPPTMFKECVPPFNGTLQQKVMLHYTSVLNVLLFQMNTAWTNRCLIKEMLRKELLESSLSGFKIQDSRLRKKS